MSSSSPAAAPPSSPSFSAALTAFVSESYDVAAPLFDAAVAEVEAVQPSVPSDVAQVRLARAANALKRKDYSLALTDSAEVCRLTPGSAVAEFRRGSALFFLDRFAEALAAFQTAEASGHPAQQTALWKRKCQAELQRSSAAAAASAATQSPSADASQAAASPPQPTPSTSSPPPLSSKVTQSWFQTASHVTVTLFAKNLAKGAVTASVDPSDSRALSARLSLPDGSEFARSWRLLYSVDPAGLQVDQSPYRVELRLKKAQEAEWPALENTEAAKVLPRANVVGPASAAAPSADPSAPAASAASVSAYPTSAKRKVEWSEVEQAAVAMEAEEKPTGDAALQKLFQGIYKDASEETRRAMVKSFQTSGGTVLSTNWYLTTHTHTANTHIPCR